MNECELNFNKICRFCKCAKDDMTSIFDNNTKNAFPRIDEMLMTLASLKVQENDALPSHICVTCTIKIQNAYTFQQQLIQTESDLWKILAQRQQYDDLNTDNTNPNEDISNFLKSLLTKSIDSDETNKPKADDFDEASETPRFTCDKCDESHLDLRSLQRHMKCSHGVTTLYECKVCQKHVTSKQDLKKHLHLHFKDRPFVCNKCKVGFNHMEQLIDHSTQCALVCYECKCQFSEKTALESHMKLHVNAEKVQDINCDYLENTEVYFKVIEYDFIKHEIVSVDSIQSDDETESGLVNLPEIESVPEKSNKQDEKSNKKKLFLCSLCNRKFTRFYHIKRHLHTHLKKNNKFSCEQCNRSYSRKDNLLEHAKSCNGELRLICDTCNKSFKSADNLQTHIESKHIDLMDENKTLTAEDLDDSNLQKFYTCRTNHDVIDDQSRALQFVHSPEDDIKRKQPKKNNLRLETDKICEDNESEFSEIDSNSDVNESEDSDLNIDENNDKSNIKLFACKLCNVTYKRFSHLKRHLHSHLKNKPFLCNLCSKAFSRRDKLNKHLKLCTGETKFSCNVCNISFASDDKLQEHKTIHSSNVSLGYETLDLEDLSDLTKMRNFYTEIYTTKDNNNPKIDCNNSPLELLEVQIIEDADENKLIKSEPGVSDDDYIPNKRKRVKKVKLNTKSSRGAGRPKKVKSKEQEEVGEYICPVCSETFDRISQLESHGMEFHSDHAVLTCNQCGGRFSRVYAMNRHMRIHKSDAEVEELKAQAEKKEVKIQKQFECDKCMKRFTTERALVFHKQKHNGDDNFVCPKCGKPFLSKSNLTEHMKFHQKAKKFLCSECGQSFIRNDYLIIHMRRHRGEKPFLCKFCGKGFPRTTDLTAHERYHTGEKTHLCVVCGRGFGRAYNLTVHMRTHTGEKPYKCQFCDAAFAQCNDLKSHVRRHTGERFHCDLCPLNFLMGHELIQHKRKIHGLNVVSNIRRLKGTEVIKGNELTPETIQLPAPIVPKQ